MCPDSGHPPGPPSPSAVSPSAVNAVNAVKDKFPLDKPLPDVDDFLVAVNNTLIPKYTCDLAGGLEACTGPQDYSCPQGACLPSWTYQTPAQSGQEHGIIAFADHLKLCNLMPPGKLDILVITEK